MDAHDDDVALVKRMLDGRLTVDLLAALDSDLQRAREPFPAVGPLPCPPAPTVVELKERVLASFGPAVADAVARLVEQQAAFDRAVDDLEQLDHAQRAAPRAQQEMTARVHAVRDARARLEALACEVRDAVAAELDRRLP